MTVRREDSGAGATVGREGRESVDGKTPKDCEVPPTPEKKKRDGFFEGH